MSKGHLSNDDFFAQLAELFKSSHQKDHGSIHLTQKRLIHGADADVFAQPTADAPFADLHPTRPLPVLMRASNGKSKKRRAAKVKLSTVVEADALERFFARYADVCKLGMAGLKKRDRSKRKQKAKKKTVKDGGGGAAVEEAKKA